jgi:hypothetical protein
MSKDELNKDQHSNFTISEKTNVKHLAFSALERIHKYNYTMSEVLELVDITEDQIKEHEAEFKELFTV